VKPKTIMLIAGEASGDMLAAELVKALRADSPSSLEFFGAGGPKMAEADVKLAFDLTQHSTIGISWLKKYFELRRLFNELVQLTIDRKPDVIIGVDYNLFNLRFAETIKNHVRNHNGKSAWNPKIVKYVSPQVWASRPARAEKMARDFDLLLSIIPFEKDWYAKRAPNLRVEFIGNPIVDRHAVGTSSTSSQISFASPDEKVTDAVERVPTILLLPGSRVAELKRHLPVILEASKQISAKQSAQFKMVLPDENLKQIADKMSAHLPNLEIQIGELAESLSQATLAIASTGTVTMECAFFGVPTIAIYKTSWSTYQIGKRIVQVKYLAMPNLIADESIFPEFIQHEATAENISHEAIDLLNTPNRYAEIKNKLSKVTESLGAPGASERAAKAILNL
jgi:lipid-A-disaccharide synthase